MHEKSGPHVGVTVSSNLSRPLPGYTGEAPAGRRHVLSFLFIAWTGLSFSWVQKLNEMHPLQIFLSSATLAD